MQFIKSIINKLLPKKSPKHLGRWRLADTNKQINHKVDLSNEDHCGPCGQYALLSKIELKNKGQIYRPLPLANL